MILSDKNYETLQKVATAFQISLRAPIINEIKQKLESTGYFGKFHFPCYLYYFSNNKLKLENSLIDIHNRLINMNEYYIVFPNKKTIKLTRREISHVQGPIMIDKEATISIAKLHYHTGCGVGNLKELFKTEEDVVPVYDAQKIINALFDIPRNKRYLYTATIRDLCKRRQLNGGLYYRWYTKDGPVEYEIDEKDAEDFITELTTSRE